MRQPPRHHLPRAVTTDEEEDIAGAIRLPTPMVLGALAASYSDANAFAGVAVGLLVELLLARLGSNERAG